MEIPAISSAPVLPPNTDLAPALSRPGSSPLVPALAASHSDSLAALFASLSPTDAAALTTLLESTALPALAAGSETALVPAPLSHTTNALVPTPAALPSAAASEHFTTVAKIDAESWLAKAAETIASLPATVRSELPPIRPELLLHAANHFYDAGGYSNYLHSTELAQTAIAYTAWPESFPIPTAAAPKPLEPATSASVLRPVIRASFARSFTTLRTHAPARLRSLWLRAPLLVLLLGWFASGLAALLLLLLLHSIAPESWPQSLSDAAFQIWSLGFLALVCFGFVARLRKPPQP